MIDLLAHPERQDSMFPQTPEQRQEDHRKETNDDVNIVNRDFNYVIERYNDAVRYTS